MSDKYDEKAKEIYYRLKDDSEHDPPIIAAALRSAAKEAYEDAAKAVPSSWLDNILSGPAAVNTHDCRGTEALLNQVRAGIVAKAAFVREYIQELESILPRLAALEAVAAAAQKLIDKKAHFVVGGTLNFGPLCAALENLAAIGGEAKP